MWRRVYLFLLAVRLYFALQPSYIHPDEHFQGPEVIAGTSEPSCTCANLAAVGDIFNWPTFKTWEFTSDTPIRSFFPLWFVYGIPMQILDWIVPGLEPPSPRITFYFLRTLFFLLSFVLEDWALQDLLTNPRHRITSLLLLSSSYVTWTYQTHTFSNSIETIVVLWSLVLIERISKSKTTAWIASAILGFTCVFGVFNRITFPAFLLLPAYKLIPHFIKCPLSLVTLISVSLLVSCYAIYLDTLFYNPLASFSIFSIRNVTPVITPLNNLLYNSKTSNLAQHGIHPRYTHLLVNLPQLLGPAIASIAFNSSRRLFNNQAFLSALSGVAVLSIFAHQEARFLIPAVPLLLTVAPLPRDIFRKRVWIAAWILFNAIYGVFMGSYHQAGLVPAQAYLSSSTNATNIVYWKTYKPPSWLLGLHNTQATTIDLMGSSVSELIGTLAPIADCSSNNGGLKETYLVAPLSAIKLDAVLDDPGLPFQLNKTWSVRKHLNMDDLDFGDDGVVETVKRVVGRRGLGIWRVVRRECEATKSGIFKDR
ncbi:Alg9-like mannosyltransferase family-domain-containing protein [Geopyxis carbonaria]|nr:Alg9-like mannosyltransferase family-domain-containing protein [Geopyxis carbonaria]